MTEKQLAAALKYAGEKLGAAADATAEGNWALAREEYAKADQALTDASDEIVELPKGLRRGYREAVSGLRIQGERLEAAFDRAAQTAQWLAEQGASVASELRARERRARFRVLNPRTLRRQLMR